MKLEEAIKTDKFVNQRHKAMINIKYTATWLGQHVNDKLRPYNISIQQFNILRILRGAETSLSVNDVRERMVEKSPNLTRLLDKLIEKSYIERTRCEEDRRVVFVKINRQGLDLLEELKKKKIVEDMPDFLNEITEEEAKIMNDCLDRIRTHSE